MPAGIGQFLIDGVQVDWLQTIRSLLQLQTDRSPVRHRVQHARNRSGRAICGPVNRHDRISVCVLDNDEPLRCVESNRDQTCLVHAAPWTIDVPETDRDRPDTASKAAQRELQAPARKIGKLQRNPDDGADCDAHSYLAGYAARLVRDGLMPHTRSRSPAAQ